MKTMSIRDLRHKWPEAESLLQVEKEIIITRDAKPVAKLVRYTEPDKPRKRFDPVEHAKWQASVFGKGKVVRLVDKYLAADREDRPLLKRRK
jgi:antitoxin (DNA-binding transcriptional repressor) of toxin-antitoxin stability system